MVFKLNNAHKHEVPGADKQFTVMQRMEHFTWTWFTCSMSTSSIAVLLSVQPYTFTGLQTIGKIFFILALVLFIAFNIGITYRFAKHPRLISISLHHPGESLFFGSWWVTAALLLISTQQYGTQYCGPWLTRFLEVAFWLYVGFSFIVAVGQYASMFSRESFPVASAMPAWVFPMYPFLLVGPLATLLIPGQSRASALIMLIGGYTMQGLAWTFSIFMYSIYVTRLFNHELPPPPTRPGMFISVGPAGYIATGLVGLGRQATNVIPAGFMGITNTNVGSVIKISSVMAGIFVWMVAFWFFALALVVLLAGVRQMKFTLHWWAMIFPNVGMATGVIQIGNALNSNGIKAVGSALTILLVTTWIFVAISCIAAVLQKHVLWEGQDDDVGEVEKLIEKLKKKKGGDEEYNADGERKMHHSEGGAKGPMDRYVRPSEH